MRRRWLLVAAGSAVAVALALSAYVTSERGSTRDELLATVDGAPILYSEFAEYGQVFTDASGHRQISNEVLLLSLINQHLALDHARELGIAIPQQEVDQLAAEAERQGLVSDLVDREGGMEAFRGRLAIRMVFEEVKRRVTANLEVSDVEVLRYFESHRPAFAEQSFGDVSFEIRQRLTRAAADAAWSAWLAKRRACAEIVITAAWIAIPTPTDRC